MSSTCSVLVLVLDVRRRRQTLIDGEVMWLRRELATILEAGVERAAFAVLQYEPLTPLVAHRRPLLRLLLGMRLEMMILVMMLWLNQRARRGSRRCFAALSACRRRLRLVRLLLKLQRRAQKATATHDYRVAHKQCKYT